MKFGAAAALGGVVLAVGFVLLFEPALAAAVGLEFTFVTLLGVLAMIQSVRFLQRRRSTSRHAAETGDPERRYEAPTPGDDVDDSLAQARGRGRYTRSRKAELQSRLRAAAVEAVADREGCSDDEAREHVAAGEWTDDPVAAWFLGDEVALPMPVRARILVRRRPLFRVGFDRTVRAVESTARMPLDGGDDR